jgi:hypothetical protein
MSVQGVSRYRNLLSAWCRERDQVERESRALGGEGRFNLIASPLSLHNMASRPVKRARTAPVVSQQPTGSSKPKRERLWQDFRSLGHISTATPFVLQSRSSKYLEQPALTVITSLGSSWAMWEGQSLRLLFVGSSHLSPTLCLGVQA